MDFHHIGIIGAGTMGSGIAQVAATAGHKVVLYDINSTQLTQADQQLKTTLAMLVQKGKLSEEQTHQITANITHTSDMQDLAGCGLVIEAIAEDLSLKQKVFRALEPLVSESCIIASNTSSLSLASIAASLKHQQRCLGIHFFNPAPVMRLVEVIPAVQTAPGTLDAAVNLIKSWGKTAAIARDTPGFIVNRVARPFYGEAIRLYEENMAAPAQIDAAMRALGFRMGPFELMDFIGHDVNYAVTESVFTAFYFDPRYRPSFTQKRLTEAGYLGRKSGRGFYDYTTDEGDLAFAKAKHTPPPDNASYIQDRILAMLINEAADALYLGIATAADIDNAMLTGTNYPRGLLAWANDKGMDWCTAQMHGLYDTYREDRYRCSPILRAYHSAGKTFDV